MAIYKSQKNKPRFPVLILTLSVLAVSLFYLLSSLNSTNSSDSHTSQGLKESVSINHKNTHYTKFLYWGNRIDCPGKHCGSCEGLGHQESSLRCALEEAMFLNRTFILPSRMCINPVHNQKGILHQASNESLEDGWAVSSCAMDTLYDLNLISKTVPVILDNSETWLQVLATSLKLGYKGVAHVAGVSRADLKERSQYSNIFLINRTASPLSWFMECKDRNDRSAIMLPYSFLPSMASKKLQDAANENASHFVTFSSLIHELVSTLKIKSLLGNYDAIHVRRGDKIKTRKDRHGTDRSLHPHLDRDTRAEFILCRISKWVPPGRTVFIASNERTPGFFSPLSARFKLAYSSNYSSIIDPLIENNYQLFMLERLILMGAKKFIRTFKEDENDLSLTDDPKKNTKVWQIPVYTKDGDECFQDSAHNP